MERRFPFYDAAKKKNILFRHRAIVRDESALRVPSDQSRGAGILFSDETSSPVSVSSMNDVLQNEQRCDKKLRQRIDGKKNKKIKKNKRKMREQRTILDVVMTALSKHRRPVESRLSINSVLRAFPPIKSHCCSETPILLTCTLLFISILE